MIFAAFSAEEIGRLGSIAFINDYLKPNNIQVTAMLNMDIIGSQTAPSVVALDDSFAVAWTDDSKALPDTDGTAVRARVIYPAFP